MQDTISSSLNTPLWQRAWQALTRAHPSFTGIDDIRRSRMTMVFSLAMGILCFVGGAASFANQGFRTGVLILWLITAICAGSYFVARTRYYQIGALLITWLFSACGYAVAVTRPDDISGALFSFIPLSLILAGGLLSFWNQIILTVFNVIATAAFPFFVPAATGTGRDAGIFLSLGLVIIVISGFRDLLDASRMLAERQQAGERLNDQFEMQKLAAQASAKFINIPVEEMGSTIQQTLREIGVLSRIDRCYLFLYSNNQTRADCAYEWCAEGIKADIQNLQNLAVVPTSWWASRILRGEVIAISRVADLPVEMEAFAKDLREQGIKSLIAVPIKYGAQVIGYIGSGVERAEKIWSESNITLLQMIGDIFANALERKRTEIEAETLRRNIEAQSWFTLGQAQLAEKIRGDLDIPTLANNVTSFLCSYLGAHTGALFLASGKALKLTGRYAYVEHKNRKSEFLFGESLVGEAAKANRIFKLAEMPEHAPLVSSALGDAKPNQILIAPIAADGRVFGVVELATLQEFSAEHETFLQRVSESVAIAFRTAQTRVQVNELLTQSQSQAEELQAQQEELRASNEELQAQSESFKSARGQKDQS